MELDVLDPESAWCGSSETGDGGLDFARSKKGQTTSEREGGTYEMVSSACPCPQKTDTVSRLSPVMIFHTSARLEKK